MTAPKSSEKLSIFLPKTSFPLHAKLSIEEPIWIEWWQNIGLYAQRRALRKGEELFVLHDGPPYSNGPAHMGHALNKILKDAVGRWEFLEGKDVSFVPGWDCHGLPIEAKIEEKYQEKNLSKADVPVENFRADCRAFSEKWIAVQKENFQRLGVVADWEHPYKTMDFPFEASIVRQVFRLLQKKYIYRGVRPVLWSTVEETALAEAEVEYKDVHSTAVFVAFPIVEPKSPVFQDTFVVIWTTTPWSLPGNRAISYAAHAVYVCIQVEEVDDEALLPVGKKIWMAESCVEKLSHTFGVKKYSVHHTAPADDFRHVVCAHPLVGAGYNHKVPFFPGEHVTTTVGTGFVHTAPGHGMEDFLLGRKHGLDIPETVSHNGFFMEDVPLFKGLSVWKAYPAIKEALLSASALVYEEKYSHAYPHSWRSKTPLLYRTIPQWFVALDDRIDGGKTLREHAIAAISTVQWYDDRAQKRLEDMIQNRPDWCLSRQRTWGVPIAEFLHKEDGRPMNDATVHERIIERVRQEGTDFWFTEKAWDVLQGTSYIADEWEKVVDIVDVWFESGVTHEAVLLEGIPKGMILPIQWPASLYLEGSDQFRGWFQSSLLAAVALEGKAPFCAVVSHGFLLDDKGRKMSKSLGNGIEPAELTETKGADILRLLILHEDYGKDIRVGPTILPCVEDIYRRFRNTFRYLLGSLKDFSMKELMAVKDMPFLEQWIHHRLWTLQQDLTRDGKKYAFHSMVNILQFFCSVDLSSFYFDTVKDSLYCDGFDSEKRKAARTTFLHLFTALVHFLSPILCFTTEEAWHTFARDILGAEDTKKAYGPSFFAKPHGKDIMDYLSTAFGGFFSPEIQQWSVHFQTFPCIPDAWNNPAMDTKMTYLAPFRQTVLAALEKCREEKHITSSLQAHVFVVLSMDRFQELLSYFSSVEDMNATLSLLCLTSGVQVVTDMPHRKEHSICSMERNGITVHIISAPGQKCQRCWKVLPCVSEATKICHRCEDVVKATDNRG